MRLLERIFSSRRREAADAAYQEAMGTSGDLIERMREHSTSESAARAMVSDIWAQHRNIPFMTSVYETVQEMNVARANGLFSRAKK